MLAARGLGLTEIFNISLGKDVLNTINALRLLGVKIEIAVGKVSVEGIGLKPFLSNNPINLYMGNSGTSARLLMGLIASSPIEVIFSGDESLSKRPMERVLKSLGEMGITYKFLSNNQLPCLVQGNAALKAINSPEIVTSAQVKSSLLFAGLTINSALKITDLKATRDHTEIMFKHYGLDISHVRGNISFKGGKEFIIGKYHVPSDPSSAAFMIALAIFNKVPNLIIKNICVNPTRIGFIACLQEMGANITFENERVMQGEKVADLKINPSVLSEINIAKEVFSSMIDEYPIFAIIAAYSNCKVSMSGLGELRYKESDRLALIAQNLESFGYPVLNISDSLVINNQKRMPISNISIKTAGDHRIAMSAIILSILLEEKILIDDIECINTSFPNFFDILKQLGIDVTKNFSLVPLNKKPYLNQ
jgi:3-phosphoshikimate 1-carboxyvinyltransferase